MTFVTPDRRRRLAMAAGLAIVALATAVPSMTAQKASPERYTATAINFHAVPGAPTVTPVDINITRWTPEAERSALFTVFTEKGQEALLKALQATAPVGNIRTPDSIAYDLRYAHRTEGPNGTERLSLVTDRPISFWEAHSGSRVSEYPFSVIELRIGSDGKGEGKLTIATKFLFEPKTRTMVLENWNDVPVQLQNVRKAKT
jgi:hypothetical protein